MSTIRSFISATVSMLVATTATIAWAAPGDLDPTFGGDGIVTTDLNSIEDAHALALQPDGKIVVAGRKLIGSPYPEIPPYTDVAVVRYNDDGSLDGTFGTGGVVTWPQSYDQDARTVLVQTDGKIVVGGAGVLLRFEADGTPDGTFGSGGEIVSSIVTGAVQQPDGKLVITTYYYNGSNYDFRVTRYNDDGTPDGSFGSGGSATTPISSDHDIANALVLQPDGKLIAGGYTRMPTDRFALVRYESDGTLDASFGTAGIVVGPGGGFYDAIAALVLQPDGKIVAAGKLGGQFTVVRYNDDGSLDTGFANGGIATVESSSDGAQAIVIQPNGKLLAVGPTASFGSPSKEITVVAFNPDGTQDPTFGNWGVVTTAPAGGADAFAAVLQPDIKLVVAGVAYPGNDDFLVARYEGAGEPIVIPSPTASPTPTVTITPTPSPTATVVPLCLPAPVSGCLEPYEIGKSQLTLKDKTPDDNDKLLWKWGTGPSTSYSDFADPTWMEDYALCIYDYVGNAPSLVLAADIPSNVTQGYCGNNCGWRYLSDGFKYRSTKAGTPHGITGVLLKSGFSSAGKGKIKVKGKGLNLPMPSLPLAQDSKITVHLVNSNGHCWGADFSPPALLNAIDQFRDRSD